MNAIKLVVQSTDKYTWSRICTNGPSELKAHISCNNIMKRRYHKIMDILRRYLRTFYYFSFVFWLVESSIICKSHTQCNCTVVYLLLYCWLTTLCDAFRVFGRRLFCDRSLSLRLACTYGMIVLTHTQLVTGLICARNIEICAILRVLSGITPLRAQYKRATPGWKLIYLFYLRGWFSGALRAEGSHSLLCWNGKETDVFRSRVKQNWSIFGLCVESSWYSCAVSNTSKSASQMRWASGPGFWSRSLTTSVIYM